MRHLCRLMAGVCIVLCSLPVTPQAQIVNSTSLRLRDRVAALTVRTVIQGNALDALNGPLPNATVRLRDARSGRIVESTTTDRLGLFVFRAVDPGTYIVELVGRDESILAASQLLNVNTGDELISTIVKIPFRLPPLGGVFGHTIQAAAIVTATAAASGVLALEVTGRDVTPRK